MLKTAEIQVPQVSVSQSFDGDKLLYAAFSKMVYLPGVKDYTRWTKENNSRWLGGLTAKVNLAFLSEIESVALLRESGNVVQLIVANKSLDEVDKAEDYKRGGGWEFPDSDPLILMNARFFRGGVYKGKIIASYDPHAETTVRYRDQECLEGDKFTDSLYREMVFSGLVDMLRGVDPQKNTASQFLTSPIWKGYNFVRDQKNRYRGGSLYRHEAPEGLVGIKEHGIN